MSDKAHPSLWQLFLVFVRVSAFTIGGGYVMLPIMQREVVQDKGWVTDEEMVDFYALGQSIPGIMGVNTATLIGYRKRGLPGAIACAVGLAAPSVVIILLVAAFLSAYFDVPWVQRAFAGIRAAVVAMIVMALWRLAKKSATTPVRITIAVASFAAIVGLHVHPILVILGGAVLGVLLFGREKA